MEGKVFIGGLNKASTKDQLVSYCQSWGPLKDAVVMEQKGFGFVTYQDPRNGMKFLEDGPHTIDGKLVEAKAAVPKG